MGRGKGIYFTDEEYDELVRESAYMALERGEPVSLSRLVREAVREFFDKRKGERASSGKSDRKRA